MRRKKIIGTLFGIMLAGVCLAGTGGPIKAEQADKIKDGIYIGTVPVGGMTKEEAKDAVNDYLDSIMDTTFTLVGAKGNFSATAEEMGVAMDTDTAVDDAAGVGKTGNLINRFKEEKQLESGNYKVNVMLQTDRQKTAQLIYDHKDVMDIPAEDNTIVRENRAFTYVEGQKGKEVNVVESVYAIEDYLNNKWDEGKDSIDLVIDEIEPRGSREELSKIQDVLGASSTNFGSSSRERATNVKTGCSRINGSILYPGEELSVYETVSPFTQENGYELAGAYANGTTVESFGGGICQVSTTLYLAAIRAELEIVKRYNHSMVVAYVKPSMDAAIAGTYKDLRIKNTYNTPIYIQGYCEGGVIYFNIYGEETRPSNREVDFESETLETIEPELKINLSSSHELGYINTDQSSHTGYKAQLWKIVTVDGVEESRELFNRSTYQASPKIITVGTKGVTKEQLAAIEAAAKSKDESAVRSAVAAAKKAQDEEPDEDPDETTEGTDGDSDGKTDTQDDDRKSQDGETSQDGDNSDDDPSGSSSDDGDASSDDESE